MRSVFQAAEFEVIESEVIEFEVIEFEVIEFEAVKLRVIELKGMEDCLSCLPAFCQKMEILQVLKGDLLSIHGFNDGTERVVP